MNAQKYPFKRIGEKLKKLRMEPKELYGVIEDSVWYPNKRFLEETHEIMLREYGGYTGYETGISLFEVILKKVKKMKGIYKKAAVLLRELTTSPRIYKDGNHRTALATTETFLNMNREKIWTENSQEIYKFIKGLLYYNINEVAEWLKNGPQKRSPS
ncbi:MAG: hypothetical protein U9O89_01400 [Thermoproteota archaeon]|nr:hypothetical protein [Thermoproteota archaeon]